MNDAERAHLNAVRVELLDNELLVQRVGRVVPSARVGAHVEPENPGPYLTGEHWGWRFAELRRDVVQLEQRDVDDRELEACREQEEVDFHEDAYERLQLSADIEQTEWVDDKKAGYLVESQLTVEIRGGYRLEKASVVQVEVERRSDPSLDARRHDHQVDCCTGCELDHQADLGHVLASRIEVVKEQTVEQEPEAGEEVVVGGVTVGEHLDQLADALRVVANRKAALDRG